MSLPAGMTEHPAVAATDVWRAFQRERVLAGVELAIPSGAAAAIMGPNGAGKSTLLRVLAASLRPQRGRVRIHGEDPWRVPAARRRIGFVGHEPMLYGGLSVLENLRLFTSLYGLPDGRARADEVCALLRIDRRGDPVRNLSRGMQQRAALARAIVHRPEVLLLDEALTGLDPDAAERLAEFLAEFRAGGGTVVLTTHSPAEALRNADRVYVLAGGRLSEGWPLAGMTVDAVQAWYRSVSAGRTGAGGGGDSGAGGRGGAAKPAAGGSRP